MDKNTTLLIGTIKGLFLATSDADRATWKTEGPHFAGRQIYAVALDERKNRLWVSASSWHWGAELYFSDDLGKTWTIPEEPLIQFPADSGETLKNIWQIEPSIHDEKTVYCGVEPACLFKSENDGESWHPVEGFFNHPHRKQWMPGGGGLCLHTIIQDKTDADLMWTAISTGGVYRSEDGGDSWAPRNKGILAPFLPDPDVEFGQCVHKVVQHPVDSNVLYLQHHWGVYRSDDGGDSWQDIGKKLPSDFGFALAISPLPPHNIYVIPLKSDEFRCVPEGKLAVYRGAGDGEWESLNNGMPEKDCYETILRDGMSVDKQDPTGIYFGTRNGNVWGSADDGKNWRLLFDNLPAVLNVKAY